MTRVIDSDQHLFEFRNLWAEHIDPSMRDDAVAIIDDDRGYPWLEWRGQKAALANVTRPGDVGALGRRRERLRQGLPPDYLYDETLPADYWNPSARAAKLDDLEVDEAVLFPHYGLLWFLLVSASVPALTANMRAWNRWCVSTRQEGGGRLHPVAHVTLRDPDWLLEELVALEAGDIHLAMLAPAPVDGRALSDPSHDRLWDAFVHHGVTPVFHVAEQPRVFDDAWYPASDPSGLPVLDAVLIDFAPQVALTDLIVNGTLAHHPDLLVGVHELGSGWVPRFISMLDAGCDFMHRYNGRVPVQLEMSPSDYFRRQVRVASFAGENPKELIDEVGNLFMCCSDYPHSEGSTNAIESYRAGGCEPADASELFHDNINALIGMQTLTPSSLTVPNRAQGAAGSHPFSGATSGQ
jgi:hypothetical protein